MNFSDIDGDTKPNILQQNHYYPYGLSQQGEWQSRLPLVGNDNKYGYNGIELQSDFGLNVDMAMYRVLDPALGRWWGIDPKPNVRESGYVSMGGSALRYADKLGDTTRLYTDKGEHFLTIHDQLPNQEHFFTMPSMENLSNNLLDTEGELNRAKIARGQSTYFIGENTRKGIKNISDKANKEELERPFMLHYTTKNKELVAKDVTNRVSRTISSIDFPQHLYSSESGEKYGTIIGFGHIHPDAAGKQKDDKWGNHSDFEKMIAINQPTDTEGLYGTGVGQDYDDVFFDNRNKAYPAIIGTSYGYTIYSTVERIKEGFHIPSDKKENVYGYSGKFLYKY